MPGRRRWWVFVGAALVVVLIAGGVWAVVLWGTIGTEDINTAELRRAIEAAPQQTSPADTLPDVLDDIEVPVTVATIPPSEPATTTTTSTAPVETTTSTAAPATTSSTSTIPAPPKGQGAPSSVNAYLLIGSDGTPSFGRADVIFLMVDPPGATPVLVSISRSLYVPSPCDDEPRRLAVLFSGCGDMGGGSGTVALALEDFTGIDIDHFVAVGFTGFPRIVDALGGIQICVDHARGIDGEIIVPAGCNLANGTTAQWWVSNRFQDELVDGTWRAVAGDGAESRSRRQYKAMLEMYKSLSSVSSPGAIAGLASSLSDTFVIDSGLSITKGAQIAWSLRSRGLATLSIPTETHITPEGKYVAVPTEPFNVTLSRAYAPAAGW